MSTVYSEGAASSGIVQSRVPSRTFDRRRKCDRRIDVADLNNCCSHWRVQRAQQQSTGNKIGDHCAVAKALSSLINRIALLQTLYLAFQAYPRACLFALRLQVVYGQTLALRSSQSWSVRVARVVVKQNVHQSISTWWWILTRRRNLAVPRDV